MCIRDRDCPSRPRRSNAQSLAGAIWACSSSSSKDAVTFGRLYTGTGTSSSSSDLLRKSPDLLEEVTGPGLSHHEQVDLFFGCRQLRVVLEVVPGFPSDQTGQDQQTDQIRQRHQPVHDIGEVPDNLQLACGAEEDNQGEQNAVSGHPPSSNQSLHVALPVVRPAQQS